MKTDTPEEVLVFIDELKDYSVILLKWQGKTGVDYGLFEDDNDGFKQVGIDMRNEHLARAAFRDYCELMARLHR